MEEISTTNTKQNYNLAKQNGRLTSNDNAQIKINRKKIPKKTSNVEQYRKPKSLWEMEREIHKHSLIGHGRFPNKRKIHNRHTKIKMQNRHIMYTRNTPHRYGNT